MLNVIPLHTFDVAGVLKGEHFRFRVHEGWCYDWCSDRLVVHPNDDSGDRAEIWPMADLFPDAAKDYDLTLDPTDPTTSRLIDRRIAEARLRQLTPTPPAIVAAVLVPISANGWDLAALTADGKRLNVPIGHALYTAADLATANLPETRRRLLVALFPPAAA